MTKDGYYIRNGKEIKKATASTPIMDKGKLFDISRIFKTEEFFKDSKGKKHKGYKDSKGNFHIKPHKKYQILWELSIGLGFRISDTLALTVADVSNPDNEITEKKTGKKRMVVLNDRLRQLVDDYIEEFDLKPEDKLIFANRKDGSKREAIDKSQAYRKLQEIVNAVLPGFRFSNHTCRKTWAYHLYLNQNKNIAVVQKALNHSSSLTTADYIGLSRKELKEILINFDPLA